MVVKEFNASVFAVVAFIDSQAGSAYQVAAFFFYMLLSPQCRILDRLAWITGVIVNLGAGVYEQRDAQRHG
jgi:hypothetical protein